MARALLLITVLLGTAALSGCANDCQQLCTEMGKYWQDCGLPFGDAEVKECRQNFRNTTGEDDFDNYKATCRQLIGVEENADGDREIALRARFSCDDMAEGPGGACAGQ